MPSAEEPLWRAEKTSALPSMSSIMISKTATAPATTTTSGWASQLVETFNRRLYGNPDGGRRLSPACRGSACGLDFGRAGTINIPSRVCNADDCRIVRRRRFAHPGAARRLHGHTLTPKKLAVISTFTREIAQHSTPAIEGLIRDAIQEDTSVASGHGSSGRNGGYVHPAGRHPEWRLGHDGDGRRRL